MGASFRAGKQFNTIIGNPISYDEQMQACDSHVNFIKSLIKKYNMDNLSVYISSYNTKFYNDLLIYLRFIRYL